MYKKKSLWWEKSLNEVNIIKSISKVVKYGNISTAKKTTEFENKIKNFLNVKNAITVSSGSMANLLLFLAIGVKAGDEIIIPNTGWISIINTCKIMNLKPVIVDLEFSRPLIDVKNIERFISKKTKVIFPVYMNGRKIDLSKIKRICKRRGIFLIEDAAQSFGVKFKNKYLGTIGDAGIFSTSITKIFTTGLGGFICTNNNRLAKKIYEMRRHGFSDIKNIRNWSKFGGNFKLSDIQCAIGIEQLKKIKKDFKSNIENFELFKKLLKPSIKYIEPAVIDIKMEKFLVTTNIIVKEEKNL